MPESSEVSANETATKAMKAWASSTGIPSELKNMAVPSMNAFIFSANPLAVLQLE